MKINNKYFHIDSNWFYIYITIGSYAEIVHSIYFVLSFVLTSLLIICLSSALTIITFSLFAIITLFAKWEEFSVRALLRSMKLELPSELRFCWTRNAVFSNALDVQEDKIMSCLIEKEWKEFQRKIEDLKWHAVPRLFSNTRHQKLQLRRWKRNRLNIAVSWYPQNSLRFNKNLFGGPIEIIVDRSILSLWRYVSLIGRVMESMPSKMIHKWHFCLTCKSLMLPHCKKFISGITAFRANRLCCLIVKKSSLVAVLPFVQTAYAAKDFFIFY